MCGFDQSNLEGIYIEGMKLSAIIFSLHQVKKKHVNIYKYIYLLEINIYMQMQ